MSVLKLAVSCPRCGRHPNERIFPIEVENHRDLEPDEPCKTHQCTGCGEVYVITAKAFQDAA